MREIRESDAELIIEWRSDPSVYQYFKNPHRLTIEEHLQWYKERYLQDDTLINWIAYWHEVPVGLFGAKKLEEKRAEISYLVDQRVRNKGIATEVVLAIENWIEAEWGLVEVVAEINKDNLPSEKLIQALGYNIQEEKGQFIIYNKISRNPE